MIVERGGRRCGCGRNGCWETVIGLSRLLEEAADVDDVLRSPGLKLEERVAEIDRRAAAGDPRTLAALHEVGRGVGVGAAALTNVLNPAVIVLSGYLGEIGAWIKDDVEAEVEAGVLAPDSGGTRIVLSTIGFSAAVRGGATVAIEHVYDDPTLVPRLSVEQLGATS
jgi:predicted NBD/HSP70 family sugar kinase